MMRVEIAVTAVVLAVWGAAAPAATIDIGTASGTAGQSVAVDVTLGTAGARVLAAQNFIAYGRDVYVPARVTGSPDCAVNPAIDKGATSFRFLPLGCDPVTACTGVRAIVLSFENLDPIADGSRLYTCQMVIPPTTPPGDYPLVNDEQLASTDDGIALETSGTDGTVTVDEAGPAVAIHIGDVAATAGSRAAVSVALGVLTGTASTVVSTSNEIGFEPETPVAALPAGAPDGVPDCLLDASLNKTAAFAFLPPGCTPGSDCTAVRAVVADPFDSGPIPDMATLYSCTIAVASDAAPGEYPLSLGMPSAMSASGPLLATGTDGSVTVSALPPACAGDCNGGGTVGINELLLGVNISLGNAQVDACTAVDVNGDGAVTVNELIQAVRSALSGCPLP
ncbi:MAG: hypothetical protein ACRERC_20910 [Candidatus Binatia bacterium]